MASKTELFWSNQCTTWNNSVHWSRHLWNSGGARAPSDFQKCLKQCTKLLKIVYYFDQNSSVLDAIPWKWTPELVSIIEFQQCTPSVPPWKGWRNAYGYSFKIKVDTLPQIMLRSGTSICYLNSLSSSKTYWHIEYWGRGILAPLDFDIFVWLDNSDQPSLIPLRSSSLLKHKVHLDL